MTAQPVMDSIFDPTREGPYKVLLERGSFFDDARDAREVPFKIYYPADFSGSDAPVILWSHGFGGNRDGAGFLSRHVASHGYVLVHITHIGTDSSLWEGQPGHPWDILRKTVIPRAMTLDRFRDVPFVIDQLPHWASANPDVGQVMRLQDYGMSGHSFGALTTQIMAGQHFPDEEEVLSQLRDERIVAGILYSPVVNSFLRDQADEVFSGIDIPLLHMTGTDDESPPEGFGYEERLKVFHHAGHPDQYLLVKNQGDHMVYNGTRGKLDSNPLRPRHEEIVNAASLAFWDAFLKGNYDAEAWLNGEGVQHYLAGDAEFRNKP